MRTLVSAVLLHLGLWLPVAQAWDDHAVPTAIALSRMPEVMSAAPVQVESLERFVNAAGDALPQVLDQEEDWARKNVAEYPARPDSLRFGSGGTDARARFVRAIRINPHSKLPLYLQRVPGREHAEKGALASDAVTLFPNSLHLIQAPFAALNEGEQIAALDGVLSACDEPDYGLDTQVWDDNGTDFGKEYGFGPQPFGNPAIDFSTQAPFHMGFFHEDGILYKAAPFLNRTYPEFRVHLYLTLARFAFHSGHPYWGWRFAGWALHYIQDLTQPYHSTLMPSASTGSLLMVNLMDMLGFHGPRQRRVQILSNRHFALENLQFGLLKELGTGEGALKESLADSAPDAGYPIYGDSDIRQVITLESNGKARSIDRALRQNLPKLLVSDPEYIFGVTDPNVSVLDTIRGQKGEHEMRLWISELMKPFGSHTRRFLLGVQSSM